MNIFNKLDKSSRFLFLIAIVGIFLSLIGLYFLGMENTDSQGNLTLIGNIIQPQNDVRVKRSDNIHWYPVNQTISCYEDDLIFTGNDSTSEITFLDGSKIVVFPNSLISLSKGLVSLESGTIEIDLSQSKGELKLQSFGEQVDLTKESKIQIKKQKGVKKIVYLNEAAAKIKLPPVMEKVRAEADIRLLAPAQGVLVPRHASQSVLFNWSGQKPGNVQLEFYKNQQQSPFLVETVSGNSFTLASDKFPEGQVFWKIRQDKTTSDTAHFQTTSNLEVTYLHPAPEEQISEREKRDVVFSWSSRLNLPEKIQIAREADFKKPIFDNQTKAQEMATTLPADGAYFWRVGTVLPNNEVQWSKSARFTFASKQMMSSMSLELPSQVLDFSVERSYPLEINDPNTCESYEVTLLRDGEKVSETALKNPQYALNKLDNGQYEVQVIGKKGAHKTEAHLKFEVKNSAPLKAPKIIKKKKKLFVNVIQGIMNAIMPSAYAEDGRIELEWEDDGSDLYEVDVLGKGDKPFIKRTVKRSTYVLVITEPGKYLWRVRSMKNDQWGPYSEFAEIDASDKVQLISSSLMISGEVISSDETGHRVQFNWRVPYNDLKYRLELFNSADGKPFKVLQITGQSKILKFSPKMKNIWWRVSATSKHGLENRNRDRDKVVFNTPKVESKTQRVASHNKYLLNAYALQNMSSFSQKVENGELSLLNKSESLMGQSMGLTAEIWPDQWMENTIITAGMDMTMLSSSTSKLNRMDISGEIGKKFWIGADRYHAFLLGLHKVVVNLDIDEASTRLDMNFLGGRYLYRKTISEKAFWEAMAEVRFLLKQEFIQPSLKAAYTYHYLLKENLYVKGFLSFERAVYKVPYNESGVTGDLTVNLQNIGAGVGIAWFLQ